ncbi:ABC transporter permease subunit [Anaeromicropila herbilytica]|uniref:ABC transmembrane type-1 domain-containing protein n=1 Tax=Anaeromicropila herbilytica TaxID=2785025 RepID=A0A7R7EK07_9FIRM|nr:ABC transporter permease subunit [Anaeromicropila herbilytica]BCN30174.1 hypothetical protein bsdtb5_14690 [Anaeromicropila herbilytica]
MSKNSKKKSTLSLIFSRLLFGQKERVETSVLEEEQVHSPMKTIVRNFKNNKLSMTGLIIFVTMFLIVFIGPNFLKLDLSYQEVTQQNIAPTSSLMKVPSKLKGHVKQIAIGSTFSVGLSDDGKVYTWGKPKEKMIKTMPSQEEMGKVVQIAAGLDHALALNSEGKLFSWGNDRFHLGSLPLDVQGVTNIKQIAAGYQFSIIVTDDGKAFGWGNTNVIDFNVGKYQGQIDKVVVASSGVIGLTKDGKVISLMTKENGYSRIPQDLGKVVDIASTSNAIAAVGDDGKVTVWGNITKNVDKVPQIDGKVVSIAAGRYHFTAITDDGKTYSWGANNFKQSTVPSSIQKADVKAVFSGYYQNYAITKDGSVLTWGLKGYVFGSDGMGRDMLTRLISGGRLTMTIGAIAVIISTIIGVTIGGISGYYGGKIDMFLMRLQEVVAGIPFLPFAMILSAIVGNRISETQRIALIMVILGLLSWPSLCRLVRAQVFAEREKEFVTAAKAMGVKENLIVFKHILPNVISVIIVNATLDFASAMLTESTLSYLGFGVIEPNPTWGNMLNGSNSGVVIQEYWWRWVIPAVALGLATICINIIGDGLRDAIDPKSQER